MSEQPEQPTPPPARRAAGRRIPWFDVLTTVAAFVLAFVVGAVLMVVSDTDVRQKFTYFFARPSDALTASADKIGGAYAALIQGAVGGYGPLTETTAQAAGARRRNHSWSSIAARLRATQGTSGGWST